MSRSSGRRLRRRCERTQRRVILSWWAKFVTLETLRDGRGDSPRQGLQEAVREIGALCDAPRYARTIAMTGGSG